jgi:SOS-response transcriptional repressor LexA
VTVTRARVLAAIAALTAELGYAPSLREIAARVGLGVSSTARQVRLLAEAGAIKRQPGIPRSITITEESKS